MTKAIELSQLGSNIDVINDTIHVTGAMRGGSSNSTGGSTLIENKYSGSNVLNILGGMHSTGATSLSYGLRPNSSGGGYVSSYANFSGGRNALQVKSDGFEFHTSPAATTAVGSAVVTNVKLKMTLDGDVGIGVTSPAAKLHVYNDGGGHATDKAGMKSQAVVKLQPHATDSTNMLFASVNSGAGMGIQVTNGPATANWDVILSPFGGRVGIGHVNPGAVLDIRRDAAGNEQMLQIRSHATAAGNFDGNYSVEIRHATSTVTHGMLVSNREANDARRTLDVADANGVFATFANGKVGIGTESPDTTLTVKGTSDGVLNLDTTDARGTLMRFKENGTTKQWVGSAEGMGGGLSGDQDDMGLRAVGNIFFSANGSERFRITDAGQLQATSAADVRLTLGSSGTAGTNNSVHVRADSANLKFMAASGGNTIFETNGTQTLKIKSNGLVGIGTIDDPADSNAFISALDVGGDGGSAIYVRKKGQATEYGLMGQWGAHFYLYNRADGPMRLYTFGVERARITGDGRFQMGSTITPAANQWSGPGLLNLQNNNADNVVDFSQGIVFTDNYGQSSGGTWTHAGIVCSGSTGYNGNLVFGTDGTGTQTNTAAGITEKVRIQHNGCVNIGSGAATGLAGGFQQPNVYIKTSGSAWYGGIHIEGAADTSLGCINHTSDGFTLGQSYRTTGSYKPILFYTNGSEKMRVNTDGTLEIGGTDASRAKLDVRHSSGHPAFNITFSDNSFYRNLGTVGPGSSDGSTGQYLHIRFRTIWNDASMTMFRITGYYPYTLYAESYFGCYRYSSNSYRYTPYGQAISNQGNKAVIHSAYNTGANPGYLVIVCDWQTTYTGLMIEHIGAGGVYASYMQHDLEIIDTKRSSGTSDLWP